MVKIYLVGGAVRDEIMGKKSKDLDYTVVAPSYEAMREYIIEMGGEIFLENPEFVTIRARIGRGTADYVLARKEYGSADGRHPERVEIGTLYDDLARRDFTMNSISKDSDGNYIDPFNGIGDIENRIIRCVGNPIDRITEDYLRLIRAARFSITKNMTVHESISWMFDDIHIVSMFAETLPTERIYEEVLKMFAHDTLASIKFFAQHPLFAMVCFPEKGIWLKATTQKI